MSYENVYVLGVFFVFGEYCYRGWIIEFLEGEKYFMDIERMISGLVSVLFIFKYFFGVEDIVVVVGGMFGFIVYIDDINEVFV